MENSLWTCNQNELRVTVHTNLTVGTALFGTDQQRFPVRAHQPSHLHVSGRRQVRAADVRPGLPHHAAAAPVRPFGGSARRQLQVGSGQPVSLPDDQGQPACGAAELGPPHRRLSAAVPAREAVGQVRPEGVFFTKD